MHACSDAELWRRAVAGDASAFGAIYERHDTAVQSYCLWRTGDRAASDDLTSLVFLEAWRRRESLAPDQASARPLLLGIAVNLIRHQRRTRRRHQAALERMQAVATLPADDEHEALARIVATERLNAIRERLQTLPRREVEVLTLVAWGELSYEETARALGLPVGTVRSRLSRARARLSDDPILRDLQSPTALSVPSRGAH